MRHLLASLALLFAGGTHALGREVQLDEMMSKHADQITWVNTCGSWRSGDRNGFYRVVHGALDAQSFLYLQWMETDKDGNHHALLSVSVPEINNDHADISLERLRCVATRSGASVLANAHFGHESKQGEVEVTLLQAPGKFRFQRRPR